MRTKSSITLAALLAGAMALSACATPVAGSRGVYASPIGTAPVTVNPTPYSTALVCLAQYARQAHVVAPSAGGFDRLVRLVLGVQDEAQGRNPGGGRLDHRYLDPAAARAFAS